MKTVPLRSMATVWSSSVDKHTVEGEIPVQLCNYVDAYKRDRVHPGPDLMRATATRAEIERNRLQIGDTVFTKDSEDPADIGLSAYIDGEAPDFVCGYHLAIARPNAATYPRFLTWALRGRPALDHFSLAARGISRYGLGLADIRSTPVAKFTFEEQRRMADFLDERVARIDQIIAARRRQVRLLEESFSAAVTAAATPPLSGIAGWVLVKFSRVARVGDGLVDPEDPRYADLPLIAPNHMDKTTGRLFAVPSARAQGAKSGKGKVVGGQVVYSKIRPGLRKAVIAPWDALCSADCYPLRLLGPIVEPGYLLTLLLGDHFTQQVIEVADRVAMPKVNRESLGEVLVWVPSPDDQLAIARRVQAEREQLDRGHTVLTDSVRLLEEYKQSLITAAVTGELDVTTASTKIPGE